MTESPTIIKYGWLPTRRANATNQASVICLEKNNTILGRREFLKSMRIACNCNPKQKCNKCSPVEAWGFKLSREMVKFTYAQPKNTKDGDDVVGYVSVRGVNARFLTRIDGQKAPPQGSGEWLGPVPVKVGSILTLGAAELQISGKMEFELVVLKSEQALKKREVQPTADAPVAKKTKAAVAPQKKIPDTVDLTAESSQESLVIEDKKAKGFCLFFVALGPSMSETRIGCLTQFAKSKGATVVQDLAKGVTHIVVESGVPPPALAKHCKFDTVGELTGFVDKHEIELVKPDWVAKARGLTLEDPTFAQVWNGLGFSTTANNKKRKVEKENCPANGRQKQAEQAPPEAKKPAAETANEGSNGNPKQRNMELSNLFAKLAKLHQDCPLQSQDEWRAYTFTRVAGRLRNLDFNVTNDEDVLERLQAINGFGPSTIQKIREYLETGECQRVIEFEKDPDRIAMDQLTHIYDVGPKRASELLNAGFMSIDQVRAGVSSGTLTTLTRNQLVGLECYEDFREKMTRKEVEAIAAIVREACLERFPKAVVELMGSYRRGSVSCGDIDILITHPDFVATTPRGAISELAERLRKRGHIYHHLTRLSGLDESEDTTDGSQDYESSEAVAMGYGSSSSYMGVFCSPVVPGKRRRIDIKFYPYRERVFASLYFIGNGHFNRSMRLYTRKVKGMSLNDHGLFRNTNIVNIPRPTDKLILEAETEKDVFDYLGLEFKTYLERDCFDAVVPKDKSNADFLESVNQNELSRDSSNHKFVH